MKSIIVALSLVSSTTFAGSIYKMDHFSEQSRPEISTKLTPGTFLQKIDHSGLLPGQTFKQRYWVDSQYAKGDQAPVIYHVCGEGDATQAYFLDDNAVEWAKSLGAHLVYLEHRYYGTSQPFSDISADHLQYLTLENVLEDLATFQKWISIEQKMNGKWIVVGGSYSATIAAIYRQKHPELVVGALAASGPMISGIGREQGSQSDINNLSYTNPSDSDGERPWAYQSCTTFGFWLAMGGSIGSPLLLPSTWLCQKLFPNAPYFNAKDYNDKYDAPYLSNAPDSPSNILFTYGSNDVWTTLGLSQQNNANPKITIRMIKGAGHHYDLNKPKGSDSAEVKAARKEFLDLAKNWLK